MQSILCRAWALAAQLQGMHSLQPKYFKTLSAPLRKGQLAPLPAAGNSQKRSIAVRLSSRESTPGTWGAQMPYRHEAKQWMHLVLTAHGNTTTRAHRTTRAYRERRRTRSCTTGGGAVAVLEGARGVDLVDCPAQLQQLPARPALDAVPPACSLQGRQSRLRPRWCIALLSRWRSHSCWFPKSVLSVGADYSRHSRRRAGVFIGILKVVWWGGL